MLRRGREGERGIGGGLLESEADFGLERPGGGPVLGSMLGAMAQRARQREGCAQGREKDRKNKKKGGEGAQIYRGGGGGLSQRSDGSFVLDPQG